MGRAKRENTTVTPAILCGSPIFTEAMLVSSAILPDFTTVEAHYQDVFSKGMVIGWKCETKCEDKIARYQEVDHANELSLRLEK